MATSRTTIMGKLTSVTTHQIMANPRAVRLIWLTMHEMRQAHPCLKNGSECVRALDSFAKPCCMKPNPTIRRSEWEPASDYKSTRQLQRKSTRYLHTQYLKGQRFYIRIRARLVQLLQTPIAPPERPHFSARTAGGTGECRKITKLVSQPGATS